MPRKKTKEAAAVRTGRQIAELLKRHGPQDAGALAEHLGISAMAVRQHLYALSDEQLVTFEEVAQPRGRPAKHWRLTERADRLFPDAHAELTVSLVGAMNEAFGTEGLDRLLSIRTRRQIDAYSDVIPRRAALKRKLAALAEIRTAEGYMAEVIPSSDGSFVFVENHCSICAAASACMGLCASELTVFQAVLGTGVSIERTEHILGGDRRCAYVVRPESKKSARSRRVPSRS